MNKCDGFFNDEFSEGGDIWVWGGLREKRVGVGREKEWVGKGK